MPLPSSLLVYGGVLLDGASLQDSLTIHRLLNSFTKAPQERPYALRKSLAGPSAQKYRISSWDGRYGPTGVVLWQWQSETAFCDISLFRQIQQRAARPIRHNFTDRLEAVEHFDGDASTTAMYLFREALGNTYSASGGFGLNSGAAAAYVEQLEVKRLDSGAVYTPVWDAPTTVATEVRIDSTGTDKFRKLLFHAAPPDVAGVIQVTYYPLYNVALHVEEFPFPGTRLGEERTSFKLSLVEIGQRSA